MTNLADELLAYFNNTPKEDIEKEWNLIHKEYAYGIELSSYVSSVENSKGDSSIDYNDVVFEHEVSESYNVDKDLSMAA